MTMASLFSPYELGELILPNRVVMAPMTRARTLDTVPAQSMALYYAQRASAGLIVTESAQVSAQGRGYLCTPGIHTPEQVAAWRNVTDAVHRAGGRIFVQLWHVGRLSHTSLLPDGGSPVGPVSVAAAHTLVQAYGHDGRPAQVPASPPAALDIAGIRRIVADFRAAAENAARAGFDGVEIHAGNGFLFEQFINAGLNTREDQYGGPSIANRLRLLLETVDAVSAAIGRQRVGVRISPFAHAGDLHEFDSEKASWLGLAGALCQRRIAYLHASHLGQAGFQRDLRKAFGGTLMLAGGFTAQTAQAALDAGEADLVVFGRPFIANPDLVERMRRGWPLAQAGKHAFYGGDERGYTDYPRYAAAQPAA
ncbi:oxidoreductase, FAD/FMN dependent [Bordetella bronchiseptica GA96-01]|uniref:alkene reductase n=1 Tax=Bordetella bronchiseptica TaxID=518 RepID=UPI00045B27CA|nr:alkene reductase [Bordetella bronchiseptica]AZW31005.1 alkene reductase [Bordetella bronchiseptica]KCV43389.1 oxidoreductase, FAD/FMN dependent [Bordetella bronchiseptica 345]KDC40437.1 oxidoreductase, FAD/FMN dependent [Bordetella bronchiseptica GA96-01]